MIFKADINNSAFKYLWLLSSCLHVYTYHHKNYEHHVIKLRYETQQCVEILIRASEMIRAEYKISDNIVKRTLHMPDVRSFMPNLLS